MKIQRTMDHRGTPAEVFEIISDPEFQQEKVAVTGPTAVAEVTPGDGGVAIRTERHLPTDQMPDVARRLLGATMTIVEEQRWGAERSDGTRRGEVRMSAPGAPISLTGRLLLEPAGAGSRLSVDADLKCSIPLVGRQIEQSAEPGVTMGIDYESELIDRWLSAED
ncbi:DUF2505 domain-containing protein [Janibacter sp. GXQ6167]|uniref:DUF2505 domain-containing protein n=1 Tax=Janibacter sp. GXQ6167 TaxID=3240791 RepID=UPI003524F1F0